jgi:hypothetical protein
MRGLWVVVALLAAGCARDVEMIARHADSGAAGCGAGRLVCDGGCVDPATDPAHCGGCDTACQDPSPLCSSGACVATCGVAFVTCGHACVDLARDPANCGGCGRVCPTGACAAGQCACPDGQGWCEAGCVDLATDPAHCGDCRQSCGAAELCLAGDCYAYVASGAATCTPSPCAADQRCCQYPAGGPAVCLDGESPGCP